MNDSASGKEQPPVVAAPVSPTAIRAQEQNTAASEQAEIRKELGEFERISIQIQRRMLLVTGVVAGVTALYVGVTLLQYLAMRDQIADARKVSIEASKVTERQLKIAESQALSLKKLASASADAAGATKISATNSERLAKSSERSIETTKESLRLDQRAWVGLVAFEGDPPTVGKPYRIRARLHNSGKTPAMNVRTVISVYHFPARSVPATLPRPQMVLGPPSLPILNPNADYLISDAIGDASGADIMLNEADVAAYTKSPITFVLYAWGRVTYDDIFRHHHWMTFCGRYNSTKNAYDACEHGNDMDEALSAARKTQ